MKKVEKILKMEMETILFLEVLSKVQCVHRWNESLHI